MDIETLKICVGWFNKNFFDHFPDCKFWIAGGALRDYWTIGYCSSDVDFFFNDRKDIVQTLLILRRDFKFKHYLITANAIKGTAVMNGKTVQIDLVKRLFPTPQHTIEEFDFTVVCCAIDREKMYYNPSFPFDLLKKKLVINALPFPLSTFQRVQKYVNKGYSICNGGILTISKALAKVDYEKPEENSLEFYPDGSVRFLRWD